MILLKSDELSFDFLETGDLYESKIKDVNINLFKGNVIDGSLNNIYLRITEHDKYYYTPLLGKNSNSIFHKALNSVKWTGCFREIKYEVVFKMSGNIFYYDIDLYSEKTAEIDLFFCNDIALSPGGNEAYIGQYIDHKPVRNKDGVTVLSRQNLKTHGKSAFIQLGALCKTIAYSTDGFQFFGRSYKVDYQIKALALETLDNDVYQYEFPFIAIQTDKIIVEGHYHTAFYGYVLEDIEGETKDILAWDKIKENSNSDTNERFEEVGSIEYEIDINHILNGRELNNNEVKMMYQTIQCEEYDNAKLISFFDREKHIVLQEKENLVERQHGHILVSTQEPRISENIITTTAYMSGVFNSHVVVGNTNHNIFLSHLRSPLNIMRINGQRIFVKINNEYQMLCQPSLFEMGLNYSKWVYKLDNDTLTITNKTKLNSPFLCLSIDSKNKIEYEFLFSNLLCLGPDEFGVTGEILEQGNKVKFLFNKNSSAYSIYPELNYTVEVEGTKMTFGGDELFYKDGRKRIFNLFTFSCSKTSRLKMYIYGSVDNVSISKKDFEFRDAAETYKANFDLLINHFKLYFSHKENKEMERFNKLIYWYTLDMLIHYTMPHGLEQYGGAAWGTRDVCQGPFEYFMCMQEYAECKNIIERVYSHQLFESGRWPQWFMFDKYNEYKQDESHGDLIIWPLKALTNYILVTGDYSILAVQLPFIEEKNDGRAKKMYSVLEHVEKQLDYVCNHFIEGTFLSKYGDGDWDDTLQPANKNLREKMVSGWTTSLTYEVLNNWYEVISNQKFTNTANGHTQANKIKEIIEGLKKDYNNYVIKDGIASGFIYFDKNNKIRHIIHPTDTETKIKYRLLPINRGIISELFTNEQAKSHLKIVYDHLYYADGVRLMNEPAQYNGGINTYFMRAETASNFGREIGLQYVHAHIRFIEAMAKFGSHDQTMDLLLKINPIQIQKTVPNADFRQSNTYFSSSDGDFKTRYEAQNEFYKLRAGEIKVKAGWRIYSSGPGIYVNQLITNVLGIRFNNQDLVIDPVLPKKYDGLFFDYVVYGKKVTFIYRFKGDSSTISQIDINRKVISFTRIENPYREGGVQLIKEEVLLALKDLNEIVVTM